MFGLFYPQGDLISQGFHLETIFTLVPDVEETFSVLKEL